MAVNWVDYFGHGSARAHRFGPPVFESRRAARLVSATAAAILQMIGHLFRPTNQK